MLLPLLLLAALQDAPETFDLKAEWTPLEGARLAQSKSSAFTMRLTLRSGERILNQAALDRSDVVRARMEILKAPGGRIREEKWTFEEARTKSEGEERRYGFDNRTVFGRYAPDRKPEFQYGDESEPAEADQEALKGLLSLPSDDEEAAKAQRELFMPPGPVRVGDEWSLDLAGMVARLFPEELSASFDLTLAKGSLALKSAERQRGGSVFGRIEGKLDLPLVRLGPLRLDKVLSLRVKVEVEGCLDGRHPDAVVRVSARLKGSSSGTVPNAGPVAVEIDLVMTEDDDTRLIREY
jgi:hypothetical protein